MLTVEIVPCLADNYAVLLYDPASAQTILIDAPEAEAVEKALARHQWRLSFILITHHHGDHTAGLSRLKRQTGAHVIGPRAEANHIDGLDQRVDDGEILRLGDQSVHVIATPGHTRGHVAYWFEERGLVFTGDTLFALGCGRILEGTAEDLWRSLEKLAQLPDETRVYCGHEYALANARFALSVDPDNVALQRRAREISARIAENEPALPSTIGLERATNPFLRTHAPALRAHVGLLEGPSLAVFTALRRLKDHFKG